MAVVFPFGGVHYNQAQYPQINEVVSPFFDSDSNDDFLKRKLRERANNFIHLANPVGDSVTRSKNAANKYYGWLLRDILVIDPIPAYYLHKIESVHEGNDYQRCGLICVVDLNQIQVQPLEIMDQKKAEDAKSIISETISNFNMVTMLYSDPKGEIDDLIRSFQESSKYMSETSDFERNQHRIYQLTDEASLNQITTMLESQNFYLMDNAPQYEAALLYQKEMKVKLGAGFTGKEAFNFLMVELFSLSEIPMEANGFHRLIRNLPAGPGEFLKQLEPAFKVAAISFSDMKMEVMARKKMRSLMSESRKMGNKVFGLYMKQVPDRYFILTLKNTGEYPAWNSEILDQAVLRNLQTSETESNASDIRIEAIDHIALDLVKAGDYSAAFILNGDVMQQVIKSAEAGNLLPFQSNYIYPRPLNGLMVYSHRYSKLGQ